MHAQLLRAKKAKVPASKKGEEVPSREEGAAAEEMEMFGTEL